MELWPVPSPYEFNDLSHYSFLHAAVAAADDVRSRVGDNAACAACCDSTARLALLVVRADARDGRRTPPRADAKPPAPAPSGAAAAPRRRRDSLSRRDRRARRRRATLRERGRPHPLAGLRGHDGGPVRPPRARRGAAGARGGRDAGLLFRGRRHHRRPRDAAGHGDARGHARRADAHHDVRIDVTGPARTTRPRARPRSRSCATSGCCRRATVFRQETWTAAKRLAVATLAASPYAAAKLTASEAAHRSRRAQRATSPSRIASGPPFRVGDDRRAGPEAVHARARRATSRRCTRATSTASARSTTTCAACSRPATSRACRRRSTPIPRRPTHATVTLSVIEAPHASASNSAPATRPTRSTRRAHRTATSNVDGHGAADATRARASNRRSSRRTLRFVRPPTAERLDRHVRGRRAAHRHREPDHAHRRGHRAPARDRRAAHAGVRHRLLRRTTRRRTARRPSRRTRSTSTASTRGATSTTCSQPTRGWMANVQLGVRRARRVDRAVRPRDRQASSAWWPLTRHDELVAARRSRRRDRAIARRHSVDLPVPHRRRHDGARLRVREPRRAAGRRGRRRPLLRGGERRGRPLDQRSRGASRRSSTPATRSTRCRELDPAVGYGVGARAAHADRPVPPRRRVRRAKRRACACTSPWGFRFDATTLDAAGRRRAAGDGAAGCARSSWPRSSSLLVVLAPATWSLGSQAALDYVLRRAVAAAEGHLDDRRRRGLAAVDGAHRAHRVARRRGRRRGAAIPRSRGRRSTSCRAGSSCRGWAPSGCRSTFKNDADSRRRDCRRSSRCRSRSTCATSASSASSGRPANGSGSVTGITFGYSGGAQRARDARDCASSPTTARSSGSARHGAPTAPFALTAALAFEGDAACARRPARSSRSPARSSASTSTPRARCATRASRSKAVRHAVRRQRCS